MRIKLLLSRIVDETTRFAFQELESLLLKEPILRGEFKFIEISLLHAETSLKYPHGLGYTPKDVIVTSVIGSGSVSWEYDKFDPSFLVLTTTAPVTIRAFIGSYR